MTDERRYELVCDDGGATAVWADGLGAKLKALPPGEVALRRLLDGRWWIGRWEPDGMHWQFAEGLDPDAAVDALLAQIGGAS